MSVNWRGRGDEQLEVEVAIATCSSSSVVVAAAAAGRTSRVDYTLLLGTPLLHSDLGCVR